MSSNSKNKNPNEVVLRDTHFLVSRTDLDGNITYVNNDFTVITGYKLEDLIGKSHNIIRHPDMPKSIFKSLWHAIKRKKPWRGIIKNKTKDGKYYWVEAEVTPFIKDNRHIGYKSVRKRVSELLVNQIEEKYEKLRKDESDEFDSWTITGENYESFDSLSKKHKIRKPELFKKMLVLIEEELGN